MPLARAAPSACGQIDAAAAREEREAWLESNAPRLHDSLADELASQHRTSLDRGNTIRDLIAERGRADRPEPLADREAWARSAVQLAEIDLEVPAFEAPGPDLDMPEFDLGP